MRRTYFMGQRDLPEIVLSEADRSLLHRTGILLGKMRALREDADDDLTTDIALASHVCLELARKDRISAQF